MDIHVLCEKNVFYLNQKPKWKVNVVYSLHKSKRVK